MGKIIWIVVVLVVLVGGYFLLSGGDDSVQDTGSGGGDEVPPVDDNVQGADDGDDAPPADGGNDVPPVDDGDDAPPADDGEEDVGAIDYLIEILSSGFSPSTLEISVGDTVTFTNTASRAVWPASNSHPTHTIYPESTGKCAKIGGSDFDACRGLAEGESFSFTFNEVGSWRYHDHNRPSMGGRIIVS